MAVAARTAPKARGVDEIITLVVTGEDKDRMADEMERIGRESDRAFFVRDAGNVRNCPAVVLIGAPNRTRKVSPCGFCGFGDCEGCEQAGGLCAIAAADLGIAVGSAASVAADQRVDNRVLFTAGKAAMALGLFPGEVANAYGIPLSATGKSPFFDRK